MERGPQNLSKIPSPENLVELKKLRARAHRLIKESERTSWEKYVSSLAADTPVSEVWRRIRSFSGKNFYNSPQALVVNDTMITTDQEMSEAFADHYESKSSSLNYDPDFRMINAIEEMRIVDFETDMSLYYNDPFSLHELDFALSSCKESAPGYDDVTYAMIQHLAPNCKNNLLKLYNKIWASKVYPNNWKVAIITPIPKNNGISTDPKQYRPISSTSCLGKIFEKMINVRLTWVLESNSFLSKFQVGCRRNNSSTDALIAIDSEIRKAFDETEHLVAVLLDLQKAYDMTWRAAIIKQLHLLGLRGTLPMIVNSFLLDRSFSVRSVEELEAIEYQESVKANSAPNTPTAQRSEEVFDNTEKCNNELFGGETRQNTKEIIGPINTPKTTIKTPKKTLERDVIIPPGKVKTRSNRY
ncbi:hypothetical protein JTB14_000188 [Gonioctena quinquepunctata]|nr:hypothetical protein JTB14_000188 [Gonioctena quinquepunctata]